MKTTSLVLSPVALACAAGLPMSAKAQLTWDSDPGAAGIQSANGTWNTTGTFWTNDNGVTNTSWINGSHARFTTGADLAIAGAISANNLSKVSGAETIIDTSEPEQSI